MQLSSPETKWRRSHAFEPLEKKNSFDGTWNRFFNLWNHILWAGFGFIMSCPRSKLHKKRHWRTEMTALPASVIDLLTCKQRHWLWTWQWIGETMRHRHLGQNNKLLSRFKVSQTNLSSKFPRGLGDRCCDTDETYDIISKTWYGIGIFFIQWKIFLIRARITYLCPITTLS